MAGFTLALLKPEHPPFPMARKATKAQAVRANEVNRTPPLRKETIRITLRANPEAWRQRWAEVGTYEI